MNLCKHGISFSEQKCIHCEHEHKLTLMQSKIDHLEKMIDYNDQILSMLIKNKNMQVDENQKISRRVDDLEKLNEKCFRANPIGEVDKKLKEIDKLLTDDLAAWNLMDERLNELEEITKRITEDDMKASGYNKKYCHECGNKNE